MLNQGGALFTFIHVQQHTIGTYLGVPTTRTDFVMKKIPGLLKTRDPFTLAIVLLTKSRRAIFTLLGFVDFQRPSA